MAWITVKINEEELGRSIPSVSVGHKRLSMNKAACKLMDVDREQYKYVQFMEDDKNPNLVGIRFWNKNANPDCVPLKKKIVDGVPIGGIDVANANLMKRVFGNISDSPKITKYRVKRDEDDAHVLVVFKT